MKGIPIRQKLLILCLGLIVAMALESIVSLLSISTIRSKWKQDQVRVHTMANELQELSLQVEKLRREKQDIFMPPNNSTTVSYHTGQVKICPEIPLKLHGRAEIHGDLLKMDEIEKLNSDVKLGGCWSPPNCTSRQRIAILVPYRDRYKHLQAFLRHMHPFLKKQQTSYRIFIIEQTNFTAFNRGFLLNVGFIEADKEEHFDCFIFHDVDLLPEVERNVYVCPQFPRLMASARSNTNYSNPERLYFGGVSVMSRYHFLRVNGFSNRFYGWGGEDDDLYARIHYKGIIIDRLPAIIGRYHSEYHKQAKPNAKRIEILLRNQKEFYKEGLVNTRYKLLKKERKRLYTRIHVQPI